MLHAMRTWLIMLALVAASCGGESDAPIVPRQQWTATEANAWYVQQPWLAGSNFIPSTAVNQLEMWQADTFDEDTIDRELGWAAELGFNTMRVFLHDLLWAEDPSGFLNRIERFLAIADSHGIATMFVLFDGVWDPFPALGEQPEPQPHTHNSRWVQSPGAEILGDADRHDELEGYVKGVIGRFRADPRVVVWDLFNEGDSSNLFYLAVELPPEQKRPRAEQLATKAFEWARAMGPTQPITSGVYDLDADDPADLTSFNQLVLAESDIVTFHSYEPPSVVQKLIAFLREYGRPILCTEYMARPEDSTFEGVMPIFKEEKIGAYNWGFVVGKTQTNYHWLSWVDMSPERANPWFHDILNADGTPYDSNETTLIRQLTGTE